MKYLDLQYSEISEELKTIFRKSFSAGEDSDIESWFSFKVMKENIKNNSGICIIAQDNKNNIIGSIYAQQESPINALEGTEKWVIVIAAVIQDSTNQGIGTNLLKEIEKNISIVGGRKIFVFTNIDDSRVINFYKKNGYEDAGVLRDYQYGKNNSAVFLLKYI